MAMIQEERKSHLEVDKIFKCKQNIFFNAILIRKCQNINTYVVLVKSRYLTIIKNLF